MKHLIAGLLILTLMISGAWYAARGQGSNYGANVAGMAAAGTPVSGNPVLVGGTDGSNTRTLKTETTGILVNSFNTNMGDNLSAAGTISGLGSAQSLAVAAYVFNGAGTTSGWDRAGYCPNFVSLVQAASTTAAIVALSASKKIRVCSFFINSAAANTAALVYGTQTTTPCDTGQISLTGPMNIALGGTIAIPGGGPGAYNAITPVSQQLCLVTGGGVGGTTGGLMWGQW